MEVCSACGGGGVLFKVFIALCRPAMSVYYSQD